MNADNLNNEYLTEYPSEKSKFWKRKLRADTPKEWNDWINLDLHTNKHNPKEKTTNFM